ncbi:MAG: deferrochelatase/peroxidase EfeB [Actinomycetota bacterium]
MVEISRRGLFATFAATGIATAAAGYYAGSEVSKSPQSSPKVSPYGPFQPGIETPMQDQLSFLSFDLKDNNRESLRQLLIKWSNLASELMEGTLAQVVAENYDLPPSNTGEAIDAQPSGLSITLGFGPTLFIDENDNDRFGIGHLIPKELRPIPRMPRDNFIPEASGGDICVQICGENSTVVFHAARSFIRAAVGTATVKWSQTGFSGKVAGDHALTPRNLFGFKDGTQNPSSSESFRDVVWISDPEEPSYMQGGTYLAIRKIRMNIETWDRTSLREQEAVFGRTRFEGAPLSGGSEFSAPDFQLRDSSGANLIPENAHLRLAHSSANGGLTMFRRGYNYNNGPDLVGYLDSGLMFLAFQKSVDKQFTPVLKRLSESDALNEYTSHIGSAVFAIPRGRVSQDDFFGRQFFS